MGLKSILIKGCVYKKAFKFLKSDWSEPKPKNINFKISALKILSKSKIEKVIINDIKNGQIIQ